MKRNLPFRIFGIFFVVLIVACQRENVSNGTTPMKGQSTEAIPFPPSTSEANPSLTPTRDLFTKQPTLSSTFESPTPTESNIQYGQLNCDFEGLDLHCKDPLLGIEFTYPSYWGYITTESVKGSCGGNFYGFFFDRSTNAVNAGGVSKDYCQPMGGDLLTLFSGFQPEKGCEYFPSAKECRQLNENVVIATFFPDYSSICSIGPGVITSPIIAVGINIPGNHPVAGLVFSIDFLSVKAKDQLFEPFDGVLINYDRCQNPETEQIFSKLVDDISLKVKLNTLDDETRYKLSGVMKFANSIRFVSQKP